jgi:hypothetical protein
MERRARYVLESCNWCTILFIYKSFGRYTSDTGAPSSGCESCDTRKHGGVVGSGWDGNVMKNKTGMSNKKQITDRTQEGLVYRYLLCM